MSRCVSSDTSMAYGWRSTFSTLCSMYLSEPLGWPYVWRLMSWATKDVTDVCCSGKPVVMFASVTSSGSACITACSMCSSHITIAVCRPACIRSLLFIHESMYVACTVSVGALTNRMSCRCDRLSYIVASCVSSSLGKCSRYCAMKWPASWCVSLP